MLDLAGQASFTLDSASSVQGAGTVSVIGPALSIASGQPFSIPNLGLYDDASLTGGGGSLTVTGSMTWQNGTISGFSSLAIASGASLTLGQPGGSYTDTLQGVQLSNAGAVTISGYQGGAALQLDSGASVDNLAGGTFTAAGSMSIQGDGAPGEAFTNEGTLVYDPADSGYSPINLVFDQAGTGSTEVDAGTLALGVGGTIDGTMTVDADATLYFEEGIFELVSTSNVQGAGTVAVAAPTVTVDGTYNISGSTFVGAPGASLTFNSDATIENLGSSVTVYAPLTLSTNQSFTIADLQVLSGYGQPMLQGGGGDLTVTGSMTWTGGTISSFSTLTISSQATLNLSPGYGGTSTLDGIALDNEGTATLTGGVIAGADGGMFNNEPGGTFDFNIPPGGACCYTGFQNITLNNYGTINWTSGNLAASSSGIFNNEPGATFNADADGLMDGDTFNNLVGATFAVANDGVVGTQMALVFNNAGAVDVNSGSLTLGYFYVTGAAVSSGTFYGAPGTELGFLASQDFTSTSNINADNVGFSWFNGAAGGLYTMAGTYQVSGATTISYTTINFTGAVCLGTSLDVYGTADFSPASPTTLNTNECTVGVLTGTTGELTGTDNFVISGPLTLSGGTSSTTGTVDAEGGMTITSGDLEYGTLNNYGAATWSGSIGIGDGATINNLSGASFDVQGDESLGYTGGAVGTFNNDPGATFDAANDGNGGAQMALSFNNAGTVNLGSTGAAGLLTISGNYNQTSTGSLDVYLGGTTAGSGYSQLAVSGTATLAGTADMSLINGFEPALGNSFQPLTFGSSSGNFGFYNGIILGNRMLLDPALNPTNLTLTVQPAATTTALASPPSPSVSGQSLTFTAMVTVALPPTTIDPDPTGTLTFYDNGNSMGMGTLAVVNGQDQASLTIATLSTTNHSITAAYTSGDTNFIPSPTSMPVTQVVNKANTNASVASSGTPSVHGQPVTVTATVSVISPGSTAVAYPTGTVTFYDNETSIGTGALSVVSGHDVATLTTSALSTTSHSITAADTSGDGNFNASAASAAITQVVNKDSTTTAVSASPTFANVAQTVTFTASVTANAPGAGTPTGPVDFFDTTTNTDLTPGGVSLSSGTATFSTTSLAVGTHTIKATYSGDTNFLTSNASTGTITIGQSIILLDPTAGGALSLSGNASIQLSGGVYVDSSSSTALSASGNATIKASVIDVTGKVSKSGNASFSPAPVTGAAAVADPLASLAEPTTSGLTNYGSESLSGNSSATIKPGIYSAITVSGNGTLTMNSGIYIIEGGGFSVSGNASVSGTGVMIFDAGSTYPSIGGTYGSISLSGNGSYNLTPPATGTYAGIVIFQSRDNTKALTLSGNASGMTGTIYAPADQLAESGNAELNAAVIVDTMAVSGNGVNNAVTLNAPSGTVAYTPAEIRAAYGISALSLDGTGQTIAIVDAYDDPNIYQALDAFDSQFGLTAAGTTLYQQYGPASSFLTVLNQNGQATSLPSTDPNGPGTNNWELEEALDVEWANAIAPGAQIILVEASSQSLSDLMASVATAAHQPGVSVVSMSWGFPEGQAVFAADEAAYDSVFNVPGVTFVASTGDYGAADPEYPAFSPNVVAVGGTSLTLNADNSYNSETGWGYESDSAGAFIGSGGGLSLYEPEPAYQQGVQSTGSRTTPDVSLVADPATGVWIADPYNLDPDNPFEIVGGTSVSAPAWAGLFALVNQGSAAAGGSTLNSSSPTDTQQALYSLPQNDYNVITSGYNGYTAAAGYNLVTGLGTPVANLLVSDLVAYQTGAFVASGPTVGPLQDAGLVNTGATDSGPTDVFSVFDSMTVTNAGLNHAGAKGASRQESAFGHATNAAGRTARPLINLAAGSTSLFGTAAGDCLAQPLTRPATSVIDQVLGTLAETNPHDTLIGDLAFEQVSSGTHKARGSAAIGASS
ncbi:MAG: Ig-like domain repeat protein [Isosphaeraceae bacterium]